MFCITLRRLAVANMLLAAAFAHAQPAPTHFVHATQLNVRAEPGAGPVAFQLPINAAVAVLRRQDGRWCEVQAGDRRGFVDCAFLGERALTLEQVEFDLANATFELQRLRKDGRLAGSGLGAVEPAAAARIAERMLGLLERHFALAPSLHTYGDYQGLLQALRALGSADPGSAPLQSLAKSRAPQVLAMRAALSFDAARALPVVRHPATTTLALALDRRTAISPRREARRAQAIARLLAGNPGGAPKASFFQRGAWATGWAGGPLVRRLPGREPEGVAYAITFDGPSAAVLADVVEMAKVHRVAVAARFGDAGIPRDSLSQAQRSADDVVESLDLRLKLPVWGITAQGLVAGVLRRASYGGDSCSGDQPGRVPTAVEVVFPQALRGDLHGVFASSVPIDPARATVSVRKRTFLAPLLGEENTFTHRVDMAVDLDGDGVPDLRTTVSSDVAVGGASAQRDRRPSRWIRPVAGWYANNVYDLEMNEEGWWRVLSLYNVVTCT